MFVLSYDAFINSFITDLHRHNIIHQEVAASSVALSDHYSYAPLMLEAIPFLSVLFSFKLYCFDSFVRIRSKGDPNAPLLAQPISAPEQWLVHVPSRLSDAWALGALIRYVCTGEELIDVAGRSHPPFPYHSSRVVDLQSGLDKSSVKSLLLPFSFIVSYPISSHSLLSLHLSPPFSLPSSIPQCPPSTLASSTASPTAFSNPIPLSA